MIRLKVKRDAQQEAPQEQGEKSSDSGKKVKILGIGRGKKTGKGKEKKRTPGEIRIQKGACARAARRLCYLQTDVYCVLLDIAELDGGKVATVTFPNPNDLTMFNVQVCVVELS